MNKLYQKSEILFAAAWIIVYISGTSLANAVSETAVMSKSAVFAFYVILSLAAVLWIKKNGLAERYGLFVKSGKSSRYLFYIPLAVISSVNLWFGIRMNMPAAETVMYVGCMLCAGFLEELIFRGFLFRAFSKRGIKSAAAASSLIFGMSHILNLSGCGGAELAEGLFGIVSATAFGYLYVTIFYKCGSLIPCIISHSIINALSTFANYDILTGGVNIAVSVFLCVSAAVYSAMLNRYLPSAEENSDK